MHELNDLNPDVMRAELAYRRQRLSASVHSVDTGLGRWLHAHLHLARAHRR